MLPLVAVYSAVTVARLGLYFVHMALAPLLLAMQDDQTHPHFLSDHIFLGAPSASPIDWEHVCNVSNPLCGVICQGCTLMLPRVHLGHPLPCRLTKSLSLNLRLCYITCTYSSGHVSQHLWLQGHHWWRSSMRKPTCSQDIYGILGLA